MWRDLKIFNGFFFLVCMCLCDHLHIHVVLKRVILLTTKLRAHQPPSATSLKQPLGNKLFRSEMNFFFCFLLNSMYVRFYMYPYVCTVGLHTFWYVAIDMLCRNVYVSYASTCNNMLYRDVYWYIAIYICYVGMLRMCMCWWAIWLLCRDVHGYVGFSNFAHACPFLLERVMKVVAVFASGNVLMHKYGDHLTA